MLDSQSSSEYVQIYIWFQRRYVEYARVYVQYIWVCGISLETCKCPLCGGNSSDKQHTRGQEDDFRLGAPFTKDMKVCEKLVDTIHKGHKVCEKWGGGGTIHKGHKGLPPHFSFHFCLLLPTPLAHQCQEDTYHHQLHTVTQKQSCISGGVE